MGGSHLATTGLDLKRWWFSVKISKSLEILHHMLRKNGQTNIRVNGMDIAIAEPIRINGGARRWIAAFRK